jgi:hypothetical protein
MVYYAVHDSSGALLGTGSTQLSFSEITQRKAINGRTVTQHDSEAELNALRQAAGLPDIE